MEIFRNCSWYSLLLFQAFSYGSYTILVHLCEENGKISFNSSSMNLTIEFIKLFISSIGIIYQQNFKSLNSIFSIKKSVQFTIPAFLYFINNNLAVYIQLYMDSTSYQLLSNLKILTTAVLYYFIIGRKMTKIRWFSLILLFFSGLFYSVGNVKSLKNYYINQEDLDSFLLPKEENINVKYRLRDEIYITEIGFFMILTYALISGLSGVYNEYLLKRNLTDSIFLQNFYLYMYGCVFNFLGFWVEKKYRNDKDFDFFKGFNFFTIMIISSQVINGFLMSIVMKYSSNITRLFIISSSLIVTTVLSILIFSLKLNAFFYLSFFVVMMALYFYTFYK